MSESGNPLDIYDTTLRDGVQREGLNLSLEDKLKIAQRSTALASRTSRADTPGQTRATRSSLPARRSCRGSTRQLLRSGRAVTRETEPRTTLTFAFLPMQAPQW